MEILSLARPENLQLGPGPNGPGLCVFVLIYSVLWQSDPVIAFLICRCKHHHQSGLKGEKTTQKQNKTYIQ